MTASVRAPSVPAATDSFRADFAALVALRARARQPLRHVALALLLAYLAAELRGTAIGAIAAVTQAIAQSSAQVAGWSGTGLIWLVRRVTPPVSYDRELVVAVAALLLVGASLVVLYRDVLRMRINARFKVRLRDTLINALAYEPSAQWRRRGAGGATDVYRGDVDGVATVSVFGFVGVLEALVQLVVYATLLIFAVGHDGWWLLAFFIAYSVTGEFLAARVGGRRQRAAIADFYSRQKEALTHTSRFFEVFRELVLLGSPVRVGRAIGDRWRTVDDRGVRVRIWTGLAGTVTEVMQQLTIPLLLLIIARTGGSVADVIGGTLLLAQMTGPLASILAFPRALTQVSPSLRTLNEALVRDTVGPPPQSVRELTLREGGPSLVVRDVSVRFEGQVGKQLSGVNLEVPPGKLLAVVGPAGKGKTTLARVIAGELAPTSGHVLVDGADVGGWPEPWRREIATFAPSPPGFLLGTIRANVAFGREVPEDEFQEAIQAAGIDPSDYPNGLETQIFTDVTPSTGQQRQIALARALCQARRLVVLDEPTAQLDRETLRRVSAGLAAFLRARGRTGIIVTHDETLVRQADFVALVTDGGIAAIGDHDTLCRTEHRYAAAMAERALESV